MKTKNDIIPESKTRSTIQTAISYLATALAALLLITLLDNIDTGISREMITRQAFELHLAWPV